MAITDYSTTPAENTSIGGINIAEGCLPGNINDAQRRMMADIAAALDGNLIGPSPEAVEDVPGLEDALAAKLDQATTISAKAADYTLALGDAYATLTMNSGSARSFTVPPQSSVAWPAGAWMQFARLGTGAVSFAAGSGVTLLSANGLTSIRDRYGMAALMRLGQDQWLLVGLLG